LEKNLKDEDLEEYFIHQRTIEVFKTAKGRAYGQKMLPHYTAHDIPVQLLSKEELKSKIPALIPDQHGGLFFPHTGHCIDTFGITQDLYKKFTRLGGSYIKSEVQSLDKVSDPLTKIILQDRNLTAQHVFVCAGGASHKICRSIGYNVPLVAERGYHIMISRPQISLKYAITYHERNFAFHMGS
jgi:D-amino-acid dehydrogenase